MPQTYGDRVTAAPQPNFSYGTAGGFTPNILVSYGSPNLAAGPTFWSTGFSDLANVLNDEPDGDSFYSVTFTADPGFTATLASFDMGNFGAQITVPGITVKDQDNNTLFSQTNVVLPASGSGHLSFSPNVTASTLTLTIDTSGLNGNSDNVGIDNIVFSQAVGVPEPASSGLTVLGALLLLVRRRAT
jgi:hypothetical protein